MVSSEAVGTLGVGLGVALVVLDFTTAGIAMMLLGVGGAVVAAAIGNEGAGGEP